MENNFKSGFVTLIGRPNVGKSTLMNKLIGQKIAITSNKPQTTRGKIQTILTTENSQIVFLDTPGIHQPRHKLGEYMVNVAEKTLKDVDIVLWLVEPEVFIGAGERYIAERLAEVKTPVILVINKMDTVKKEDLLVVIDAYSKLRKFEAIIPISAFTGDNTKSLLDKINEMLPVGPKYFSEETVTDQPERQIVAELVREQALRQLDKEIPHGIAVVLDQMVKRPDKDFYDIEVTIICEKDSHKGIIIGKQGAMLKSIGTFARREIQNLLNAKVNLQIWVKVRKDWRDSDIQLKNFGYDKKNV
ncbi:MAG: GTP-binding protein Era [Clostridiales bacterium]|jgi:GTP-binding protein Era|nr:GTP-binding protein Era [Clostridiales bacterium]